MDRYGSGLVLVVIEADAEEVVALFGSLTPKINRYRK